MNETRFLARQLVAWTDEIVVQKGGSKAIKTAFPYLYRRYEYLKSTTVRMSVEAEKLFINIFGSKVNLVKCDWDTTLNPILPDYSDPCKKTPPLYKKIKVRSVLHWEHYDTAYEFKELLLDLKKQGKLNENEVFKRLNQLQICWVTKEENKRLDKKYRHKRFDPAVAYKNCKITII